MFKNIKKYMQKTREINIKCSRCKKDVIINKGKFFKKDGAKDHSFIIRCDNCGKKIDISNMFSEVALDIDSSTSGNCSNIEDLRVSTNIDNRNRYDKYKDRNYKNGYSTSGYKRYQTSYPKSNYSKSNISLSSNSSYIEKVVYKPILTNTSDVAISNTKPFNLFNSCEKNKNFNNAIDIDKAYRMSKKLNNSLMQSYCVINCVVCGKEYKLHEVNRDYICKECSEIENINFTTTVTTQTEYNTKTYKDENGNKHTLKQKIIKEVKLDNMDITRGLTTESSYKIRGKYKNMFDYYKNKAKDNSYVDDNIIDNEYSEDSNNHDNNEVYTKEIKELKIINVVCECCEREFKDIEGLKHYICSTCTKKEEFEKDIKEDEQNVTKEIKEDTIIIKKEMQNDEILSTKITDKESGNRKEIVNVICSCCDKEFKDLKGLKIYICSNCSEENSSVDTNEFIEHKEITKEEDTEVILLYKEEIADKENVDIDNILKEEIKESIDKEVSDGGLLKDSPGKEHNNETEKLLESTHQEIIYICSLCGRESVDKVCKHCYK